MDNSTKVLEIDTFQMIRTPGRHRAFDRKSTMTNCYSIKMCFYRRQAKLFVFKSWTEILKKSFSRDWCWLDMSGSRQACIRNVWIFGISVSPYINIYISSNSARVSVYSGKFELKIKLSLPTQLSIPWDLDLSRNLNKTQI